MKMNIKPFCNLKKNKQSLKLNQFNMSKTTDLRNRDQSKQQNLNFEVSSIWLYQSKPVKRDEKPKQFLV